MHVAGEHRGYPPGDVRAADHVGRAAEGVARRTHPGTLEAVVDAQQRDVRVAGTPPRRRHQLPEAPPDVVAPVGKAEERDAASTRVDVERAGTVEDPDPGVRGESGVGDAAPLVVARHDEHGDARLRDASQRLQRLRGECRMHPCAVEDVPTVHDQVHVPGEGGRERQTVVGQEVAAAPPPTDPGRQRQVEAEVRVGQEEDPERHAARYEVRLFFGSGYGRT